MRDARPFSAGTVLIVTDEVSCVSVTLALAPAFALAPAMTSGMACLPGVRPSIGISGLMSVP